MKKNIFRLVLCTCLMAFQTIYAEEVFTTKATHAYLIDYHTNTVLFDKNGDSLMPPASMSKLMTVYIVLDKIKKGQLSLDEEFTVSENAWRKGGGKSGGSTMFLNPKTKVKVKDLLKGIIVQSGNDACIVVAENIAGSEENFAKEMNLKAREIGLDKSTFQNATGLTDEGHLMTPKELAFLAKKIIQDFPEFYTIYSEKSFTYNKIKQENRNPLLYSMPNQADGLKTGHTAKSGYGLTASVQSVDKKRRLILVVNGLKSMKERGIETKKILDWGLREFDNYTPFKAGDNIEKIPVWLGKIETVNATLEKDALFTAGRLNYLKKEIKIIYDSPIRAPIKKGQKLGILRISIPNEGVYDFSLVANEDIQKMGYFGKLKTAIFYLLSIHPTGT